MTDTLLRSSGTTVPHTSQPHQQHQLPPKSQLYLQNKGHPKFIPHASSSRDTAFGDYDAIGARVTITAGDLTRSAERRAGQSYLSTNSPWLHFGLGDLETTDKANPPKATITVNWPGAKPKTYGPFDLDQHLVIEE